MPGVKSLACNSVTPRWGLRDMDDVAASGLCGSAVQYWRPSKTGLMA